ncbi:MAG: aspartate aminotransferase family protein [Acidimicrobiia bacterium]|nr:aspartate aminotransferase family protein [Acidimicrobiia bacterium]
MPTNEELFRRHQAVLPSWVAVYHDEAIAIEHGKGRTVWDVEGNEYLDFFGGVVTTMIGHSVPEITTAVQQQAERIVHTSTLYVSEPMVELAEMVTELSGIPDAKVFFTTSGTEANDAALLLATSYRRSNQVLALRNSYHGRSFTAIAITGNRSWSPTSVSGLNVNYVHGGYPLRSPFRHLDDDAFIQASVDDLEQVIDMMTSGEVACFIAEPIQGVGGFTTPPDGLLGAMQKTLADNGILYISDEVQTGWGRTGEHFWGYQAHGVTPDLLTFAKGVGNGVTLGGVVGRAEILDSLQAKSISTFGGNPLSCAAGIATLRYLIDNDLQSNALVMGRRLRARLEAVVDRTDWVAEVRGKGLMQGLEIVHPGSLAPSPERATAFHEGCKLRGLLLGKGGLYGNALRISPPLTVTSAEIDRACDIIDDVVGGMG